MKSNDTEERLLEPEDIDQPTNDYSWLAACCACFCGWMREDNPGPGGPSSVCLALVILTGLGVGGYFLTTKVLNPSSAPPIADNCKSITYRSASACVDMVGVSPEGSSYSGNTTICSDDNSALSVDFLAKKNWQAVTFSTSDNTETGSVTVLYSGHIKTIIGNLTFTKASECFVDISAPPVVCDSMTYVNSDKENCYFTLTDLNPLGTIWTGPTDLMPQESGTAFYAQSSNYITADFDIYCVDYVGHATIYSEPTGELNVNGPVQVTPIDSCKLAINYSNSGLFGLRGREEMMDKKNTITYH